MSNTHDYTWGDEFEPIGTIPVVGDMIQKVEDSISVPTGTTTRVRRVDEERAYTGLFVRVIENNWEPIMDQFMDGRTRILKRKKSPEKPSENKENPQKMDERVQILDENDLFSLAADRIEIRSDGYGPEQSFGHIARRWNVMMENRGSDFRFSACDVALFMLDFKLGRRESRASSGKAKRDDFTDACGYLWWADKLVEEE